MVWYNPWNQYVSSNWKFDFSLPSLFILDILLLLVDLIDLINLDFPSSICLLLILLVFFLTMYGRPFYKYLKNFIYFPIFLSYGVSFLLLDTTLRDNEFRSGVVCWITLDSVNVSRSIWIPYLLFRHWASPVVEPLCESPFNMLCCFPLF